MIHFFNLKGSLLSLPPKLYVIDDLSHEKLLKVSRSDFLRNPEPEYWIDKVLKENPSLNKSQLRFDFKNDT